MIWCNRINFISVIFFIIYIDYLLNVSNILQGNVECSDKGLHITCKFNNIYYYKNKWMLFSNKNISFNHCVNAYAKKLGKCWNINIHNLKPNQYNNIRANRIYYGLTSPFKLTYTSNYGHALWDDLYSLYTSYVKLGYKNEKFNLALDHNYKKTHYLNDILKAIEKFSKGRNIYLDNVRNKALLFKSLIVGSSHQCQRCVTPDYTLKYAREYNITKLIRDRMYDVFNIKPKLTYPVEGIIVHNKRYSKYEINLLKNITAYYQNNNHIKLKYIDYRNISTFYDQLRLLSRTHIYVSGPGTGLLNFPFMSDPGVIIHLGHIHFGCPQYLEQYILEGSPHFKALYYSPEKRMKQLNCNYIISLINLAVKLINNNNIFYSKKEENLNDIGKLYVKICRDHLDICEKLINLYDWGYGKCRGIWAENVVFFPSLYKQIPELINIVASYNNTYNLGCKIGINYSKQKQCRK